MNPVSNGWAGFCGFGVGLLALNETQLHVGMLQERAGQVRFIHLAWHRKIEDEAPEDIPGLHWANSGLDDVNREVMRDFVRTLASNPRALAYGFDTDGGAFDKETGEPMPLPPGRGFTCATFILGAHKFRGLNLLDEGSWPARDGDRLWQQQIINTLSAYCDHVGEDAAEHIAALQAQVGARRFRPEEVAAGFISEDIPLSFAPARALADEVVRRLQVGDSAEDDGSGR